tara:strand:+ start:65 stop:556 length:492 start_codon:yes stop_codon:yes gene_type:complete
MGRVFFNTRANTHTLSASDSTYQCLASDSGKTFILDTNTALAITLPADADIEIGWNARFFMVTDHANTAITIKASAVDAQNFIGGVDYQITGAATADIFHGYITSAIADTNSQIALDHDLANNMASVGTDITVMKTAANTFFVSGHVASVDADGTGAAIFSNI